MGFNNLFEGRTLHCEKCGFEFVSRNNLESMWTTVQVDDKLIDYCPFCWGVPRQRIPKEVIEAHAKFKAKRGQNHE